MCRLLVGQMVLAAGLQLAGGLAGAGELLGQIGGDILHVHTHGTLTGAYRDDVNHG